MQIHIWPRRLPQFRSQYQVRRLGGRRRPGFEGLESRELLAILYVAPTGSDSGPGTTASPFKNIQEAVTAASSGDQIRVATGTYTYSPISDHFGNNNQFSYSGSLGTTAVVSIIGKQLSILGGYSTTNWVTADPTDNPTVINGQGLYRGIMVLGTSSTTGLDLEGFTVENGLATGISTRSGLDSIYGFGGGIFVDMGGAQGQTSPFAFSNVNFINNRAVGSPSNNADGADGAGGAIALRYVSNSVFANDTFTGNLAVGATGQTVGGNALGGAIHIDHSNMLGANLTFTGNIAVAGSAPGGSGVDPTTKATADALGGAIAAIAASNVALFNVTATGNLALAGSASATATSQGGSGYGGAFYTEGADVALSLTSAYIYGNQAWGGSGGTGGMGAGGGIETTSSALNLNQSYVVGNAAASGSSSTNGTAGGGGGGGLYLTRYTGSAASNVVNSVIAGNTVIIGSGSGAANGGGGGIWAQGVPLTLTQDTIDNNNLDPRLVYGQALLALNYGVPTATVVNINDSIISNETSTNGGAIEVFQGNQVNLNHVLSWNNHRLSGITEGGISGLDSVITANPSTAVPSIYQSAGSPQWNYHLNTSVRNPAIGAAKGSTVAVDIDGNPRGSSPDLGAAQATIPNVSFSGGAIVKAGGNAVVTLVRRGDLTNAATVLVSITAGSSARSGVDYQPFGTNGVATVNFAAGASTATVVLPTIANATLGASRVINLSLSLLPNGGSGAQLGALTQTSVTIVGTVSVTPPPPVSGFAVTGFQEVSGARGVSGVLLQFNAGLNARVARNRADYVLAPLTGGRAPRISQVSYFAASNAVFIRFSAPLRRGSSALLALNVGLLKDTSGRTLTGTTTFTVTA